MSVSLPPMITVRTLGLFPEILQAQIGARSFDRAVQRSGLSHLVFQNQDLFIPEPMLCTFLHNTARELAGDGLGLLLAPHLTVADYDLWGRYVLGAPTLREGLFRVLQTMWLHSSDTVALNVVNGKSGCFTYVFGSRSEYAYKHVAVAAAGIVCSIFKAYLGSSWRPAAIDLDIPETATTSAYEDVFQCPVRFGRSAVAVWFAADQLGTPRPFATSEVVTSADVLRKRFGGTPKTATDKVKQLMMLQLLEDTPNLEASAQAMGIGTRTLQRALASEGMSFRELANVAIAKRSEELLSDSGLSVTEIAANLGYSSSAHFARAFRRQTGQSPSDFRLRHARFGRPTGQAA